MGIIIGITCSFQEVENYFYLRAWYIDKLVCAGATPFIIPATTNMAVVDSYVEACDGFVLAGGGDIDPVYWGEEPEPGLGEVDPTRDEFELQLIKKLMQRDTAVLGICRGAQAINVAAGGSVIQHLKDGLLHIQKAPPAHPFHDILIKRGTRLYEIAGSEKIRVNSFHHQAVGRLGDGLIASATARDGVVEAVESRCHRFIIGVQWHPEFMIDAVSDRLFQALVEAAGSARKSRSDFSAQPVLPT